MLSMKKKLLEHWEETKGRLNLTDVEYLIIFLKVTEDVVAIVLDELYPMLEANNNDVDSLDINEVTESSNSINDAESCLMHGATCV